MADKDVQRGAAAFRRQLPPLVKMSMQSCPAVRERVSGLKPKTKGRLLLDELVENANLPESFVLREDSPLGDEIARWELVSKASGARSAQRIPPIAAQLVGDQARPKVSGLLDVAPRLFSGVLAWPCGAYPVRR